MSGDHDDRTLDGVIDGYHMGSVDVTPMGAAEPHLLPGPCTVTVVLVAGELPDWFDVGQRVRLGRRA